MVWTIYVLPSLTRAPLFMCYIRFDIRTVIIVNILNFYLFVTRFKYFVYYTSYKYRF